MGGIQRGFGEKMYENIGNVCIVSLLLALLAGFALLTLFLVDGATRAAVAGVLTLLVAGWITVIVQNDFGKVEIVTGRYGSLIDVTNDRRVYGIETKCLKKIQPGLYRVGGTRYYRVIPAREEYELVVETTPDSKLFWLAGEKKARKNDKPVVIAAGSRDNGLHGRTSSCFTALWRWDPNTWKGEEKSGIENGQLILVQYK